MTICEYCKQVYESGTNRDKQRYCSPECRIANNNAKRGEVKKCLNCGKETKKKYCCLKCGTDYRNKNRA